MTMEQIGKERLVKRKSFRIFLLFLGVFLLSLLASDLYCLLVHVYDYTVCDGIFIWDSEEKEGTIYLYHPYRNTTALFTDYDWVVWLKCDNSYKGHHLEKYYPPVQTEGIVTRQDLLERFGDTTIVDTLMKHDYMTELIVDQNWGSGYWGEDENGEHILFEMAIEKGKYGLTPLPEKENLSYAFCKVSGNINESALIAQRAKHWRERGD